MKKKLTAALGLFFACISLHSIAFESTRHSFGLDLLGGDAKYKGKSTDVAIGSSYLYYNYQYNQHFAIEVGLQGGEETDDWVCNKVSGDEWRCLNKDKPMFDFDANNIEFSSLVTAVRWKLATSKNNSFYAKAGLQFYEYEFSRDNKSLIEDDGTGVFLGAGWQYQWDNGLGVNAGFAYQTMGDLKPQDMINIGISYHF